LKNSCIASWPNRVAKDSLALALATSLCSTQAVIPAKASGFAWGCFGPEALGKGLRIIKAREPGSDLVVIRTKTNGIALRLTSAGPPAEVIVPNAGRNGEGGIMLKRVYKDASGKRWIYSNWDAHATFAPYEKSDVVINCHP